MMCGFTMAFRIRLYKQCGPRGVCAMHRRQSKFCEIPLELRTDDDNERE